MPDKKKPRIDGAITVTRVSRMPILRAQDRLRWMLGEDEFHAPWEVGCDKTAGAIEFAIQETCNRIPKLAERMKNYRPSLHLTGKEAEATPLDKIMDELNATIVKEVGEKV